MATARSFILNRGIVTDTMSATPLEPGWECTAISYYDASQMTNIRFVLQFYFCGEQKDIVSLQGALTVMLTAVLSDLF